MRTLLLLTFWIFLFACDKQQNPQSSSGPDCIAFLNNLNQTLFVTEEDHEIALSVLEMTRTSDSTATYTESGQDYPVVMHFVNNPFDYANDLEIFWVDSLPPRPFPLPAIKVHKNARCDVRHAGFWSPCMGTFGKHKPFGQSMDWRVNPWVSCGKGDTICIETFLQVGSIFYYPNPNCWWMDSIPPPSVPIKRFRCN